MIKYYTGANSCIGYVSFLKENIAGCSRLLVAQNTTKETRAKIYEGLKESCTELIMKAGTSDDYDGIITGSGDIVFRTEEGIGGKRFTFTKSDNPDLPRAETEMFTHLSNAKEIHDRWETVYISAMDFKKMEEISENTAQILLSGLTKNRTGANKTRFFGSMTADSPINFIDDLTEGFKKRIFIKGRPGTGKSTLLKKVREIAMRSGFDTETYLCSFDPGSFDMVAVRDMGVCIFDSTAPHEMFPCRVGDEILDVYDIAVKDGTDEDNKDLLKQISEEYSAEMQKAKEALAIITQNLPSPPQSEELISEIINTLK